MATPSSRTESGEPLMSTRPRPFVAISRLTMISGSDASTPISSSSSCAARGTSKTASAVMRSAPPRIISVEPRAPRRNSSESISSDFPAPVSPVSTFSPAPGSIANSSTIARLRTLRYVITARESLTAATLLWYQAERESNDETFEHLCDRGAGRGCVYSRTGARHEDSGAECRDESGAEGVGHARCVDAAWRERAAAVAAGSRAAAIRSAVAAVAVIPRAAGGAGRRAAATGGRATGRAGVSQGAEHSNRPRDEGIVQRARRERHQRRSGQSSDHRRRPRAVSSSDAGVPRSCALLRWRDRRTVGPQFGDHGLVVAEGTWTGHHGRRGRRNVPLDGASRGRRPGSDDLHVDRRRYERSV